eukprot:2301614-Pyramimonas_sp.AAC.1
MFGGLMCNRGVCSSIDLDFMTLMNGTCLMHSVGMGQSGVIGVYATLVSKSSRPYHGAHQKATLNTISLKALATCPGNRCG